MGLTDSCRSEVALYNRYKAPRCQHFCFPSDLISHITQNPSSANGLLKIQKTCKYFFAKNKIVPIGNIQLLFFEKHSIGWNNYNSGRKYYFNISLKWWLINGLKLRKEMVPIMHVYRCTLDKLDIRRVNLTLNEFIFLINGNKIKHLDLGSVKIRDDKGIRLSIDQILGKFSNLENFHYNCPKEVYDTKTFEKMNLLESNSKYKSFSLVIFKISTKVNISLLSKFIAKNIDDFASITIKFLMENKEYYENIFKTIIDDALQNWDKEKKPQVKLL